MNPQSTAQILDMGTEASALRAREIRELHGAVERAEKLTVEKRIRIGQLLVEEKKANKGTFTAWIEANCSFSVSTATHYMNAYWDDQLAHSPELVKVPSQNAFTAQHIPTVNGVNRTRCVQLLLEAVGLTEWPKLAAPDTLQKLIDAAEGIRKDRAATYGRARQPKFVGYQKRLADAGLMAWAAGKDTRKARLAELLKLAGLTEYPKGPLVPEIEAKLVAAIERMKAARAGKADLKANVTVTELRVVLPESKQAQFDKAVERAVAIQAARLESEFAARVAAAVAEERKLLSEARMKATAELQNLIEQQKHVDAYITEDEFRLIRSCLHPDREADPERKRKAFDLFNRFETKVSSDARTRKRNGWSTKS